MNRPAKDMVYIDCTDEHVPYHKENLIKLEFFEGDMNDRDLIDVIPFLDHLAKYPGDVRREITRYGGADNCAKTFNNQ